MKCAAFELPFGADERFGREEVQEILRLLAEEGFVHLVDDAGAGQWHWTSESYPADAVSLRSISSDNFVVVDTTRGADVIGETDFTSALSTLHEKAIYLVEGRLFQVEKLDFEGRKAYVRSVECDYYTDAITYSRVTILDVFNSEAAIVAPASPDAVLSPRCRRCPPSRSSRTATCAWCRASWASRRSSSTRTRTSAAASSTCRSSRCTRRRTG